ncbi:Nucleus export protein [Sparassis crispa]|uniref:Nucleus export protein n=1 Tax=Sparassis crispa TaxID=139825 RepID=A0A401G962_9APHY|nr:Nucleus export protein [Sparassis crispa]GBE78697.1 Nucleus export protein [Sparassis crispa]
MDFEFTSRPSSNVRPVWATGGDDPSTPRKRSLQDTNSPTPSFPAPSHTPAFAAFGQNSNIPFLFQEPPPHSAYKPAWVPPTDFSPQKAFPQPELKDVDMSELSPLQPTAPLAEKDSEGERAVALGAVRRVYRSRQRARERSMLRKGRSREVHEDESESGDESDDEDRRIPPAQNMSNHYTLNMSGSAASRSDLPYVLLGYLQFFFNLSLILVFLYLLVQFILTVQRDVEQRISEYSMDVVQEIGQCAMHYKANLCASNSIPAMAHQCATWETCMNRDPSKVGRAKVGAELIAEVVNSFVEPISWKTLIFALTSLSFLTVFINMLLSLYRSRHHFGSTTSNAPQAPIIPSFPIPPATPYSHPHNYLTPAPEWNKSWSGSETAQTPSRRRRLESGLAAKVQ